MIFLAVLDTSERDFFSELFHHYRIPMWKYAYSITGDQGAADDIVQTAFVRLMDKADLLISFNSFKLSAYVSVTIRRLAIRHNRSQSVVQLMDSGELDRLADTGTSFEGAAVDRAALLSALAALSEDSRDIIALYYYFGFAHKEIAAILQIKPAAARKRLSRAVAQLKQRIQGEHHDG